ncbi:LPXTG cell wall anchor domain-containing protein [Brevibacterium sp. R8603A2]|uniref:LPXTG cell wall anchor domain-containing protein n=1 Tax=Brevibacterium sp. R8603A2 TaxID=2929779 RepID=UPI001FFB401A|nr:LPXTG cell wall anchor domain-containing protein [Brevibacterium sp. R8603A2]
MKKSIVLAPAVAIAISGFGATAVSAAPTPSPAPTPTETETATPEPEAAEPTASLSAETVSADDFVNEDTAIKGSGQDFPTGTYTLQVNPSSDSVKDYELDATVAEDGILGVTIFGQSADNPDAYVGDYTVQIMGPDGNQVGAALQFTVAASDDDDETETPSPTPTETETATASPTPTPTEDDDADEDEWTWNGAELKEGLNLESDRVTPEKFVDEGVAFAVRGCEPGQDVTFEVRAGRDDVRPYTETVAADENGIAVHGVKGLDADQAEAYIGEYTVTATCGENSWTDAFTVGYGDDDANPGDDDSSDDNGSDDNAGGNELPRTGTELTGLAAGAGLLVIGAATMMLTRRRGAKTGPADI